MNNIKSEERKYFQEIKYKAAKTYLSRGLSVLPTLAGKKPFESWGKLQSEKMLQDDVENSFKNDKIEGIGIICGRVSGDLLVLDVDCKYDLTGCLWVNLSATIKEKYPELWEKFVIVQTVNNGYHIYYRCEEIQGNQKLAQRPTTEEERELTCKDATGEGSTEEEALKKSNNDKLRVLIETRGEGGYVIAPPSPGYNIISSSKTDKIPTISKEESEGLLAICRSFDEMPPTTLPEEYKTINEKKEWDGLSPFDDYNRRADVVSLLESNGWTKLKQSGDRIHLKRPGKTDSPTSGNFHISKRLLYVFSSSTSFNSGAAYNPVQVYTMLECNNDYSEASKRLYNAGYGDRRPSAERVTINKKPTEKQPKIGLLPIEGLPSFVQEYITTCADVYGSSQDYWAAAALMAVALALGANYRQIGKYDNAPIFWMTLIGIISNGKTPVITTTLKPFYQRDKESHSEWKELFQKWEEIENMTVKQRKEQAYSKTLAPGCKQMIISDSTPEGLFKAHSSNQRGLMIVRDELKGMLDDYGRRPSGEQSSMLSTFNQVPWQINRKGGGSESVQRIDMPHINIFGGMQPDLLSSLAADNRLDNGFLARLAFVWPDDELSPYYSTKTVPALLIKEWRDYINEMISLPQQINIPLSRDAEEIYIAWYNSNRDKIRSEDSFHLQGAYGKLDIISLRLALVIHGMGDLYGAQISGPEMRSALNITEYFRGTALKVHHKLFDNRPGSVNKKDVIKYLAGVEVDSKKINSQNDIAAVTGITQQYVQKILNKS